MLPASPLNLITCRPSRKQCCVSMRRVYGNSANIQSQRLLGCTLQHASFGGLTPTPAVHAPKKSSAPTGGAKSRKGDTSSQAATRRKGKAVVQKTEGLPSQPRGEATSSPRRRFFVDSYSAALKELQRADVLHLGNVDHIVRGVFGALLDVDTLVESGLFRPAEAPARSVKKRPKMTAGPLDVSLPFDSDAASSHYVRFSIGYQKDRTSPFSNPNVAALAQTIRFFFENPAVGLELAGFGSVPLVDGGRGSVTRWLEGKALPDGVPLLKEGLEVFEAARLRLCLDFLRAFRASTVGLPVNGVYQSRKALAGGTAPQPSTGQKKGTKSGAGRQPTPPHHHTYPLSRTPHPTQSQVVVESMATSPPNTQKANFESALTAVEDTIPSLKGPSPTPRSEGAPYPRGVATPGSLSRIAVPRAPAPTGSEFDAPATTAPATSVSCGVTGCGGNPAMAADPVAPPTVPDRFRLGAGLVNLCIPVDPFHIQNIIETRPCTLVPIALIVEALANAHRNGITNSDTPIFHTVYRRSETVRYLSIPEVQFLPTARKVLQGKRGTSIDEISKVQVGGCVSPTILGFAFNRVKGIITVAEVPGVDAKLLSELHQNGSDNAKGSLASNLKRLDKLSEFIAAVLSHPTLLRAFYPIFAYLPGKISALSVDCSAKAGECFTHKPTLPRVVDRDTGASIASIRDAALVSMQSSGVWYLPTLTLGSRAALGLSLLHHLELIKTRGLGGALRDSFVAFASAHTTAAPSSTASPANSSNDDGFAIRSALDAEAEGWLRTISVLNGTSNDQVAMEKAIALPTHTRTYLLQSAEEELLKLEKRGWVRKVVGETLPVANASPEGTSPQMLPSRSSAAVKTNLSGAQVASFFSGAYSPITDPGAFFGRLTSLALASTLPTTTITETNGVVRVTLTTQYMGARDPAEEGGSSTLEAVAKRRVERGSHAAASGKAATSDVLGLQEGYLHYYQYSVTIQNISASKNAPEIPHEQAVLTGARPSRIALLSRHWVFCDALGFEDVSTIVPQQDGALSRELVPGVVREVVGPGVVGNNPILGPGESFTYDSGVCCKRSDGVYMRGRLQFVQLDDVVDFESTEEAAAARVAPQVSPTNEADTNSVILSTMSTVLPDAVVSAALQMYQMAKEALPQITLQERRPDKKETLQGKKSSYALRVDMPISWLRTKPVPEHHFDAHITATALRAEARE